jgi:hypothetical protein
MKISVDDADELGKLEALSDAELVKLVRDGFKEFRGSGKAADAEDPPADPSSARHGGKSVATLETSASRAATDAALLKAYDQSLRSADHVQEMEQIIPHYGRL